MRTRALLPALPALFLALLLFSPSSVTAQRSPRASGSFDVLVAHPQGEFAAYVDAGFGGEATGRIAIDPAGIVSLRGNLGFLIYGYESKNVCISETVGCRVQARLRTTNNIFFGGIGPELAIPTPWIRPYVNAFMGFGYFNTTSSLEEQWSMEDYFTTQNLGDGNFAWGFGGGVEVTLSRGRVPVSLNFGARYHRNGLMEYLREGDIVDHPDGSITLRPIVSEANLVAYRIGVSLGIPGS